MSSQSRPPTISPAPMANELKQRVIACLNKLSDRDTLALATAELESIARNLTHDSFSCFLSCLHNTDDSCKSTVRKQCVNLLSLLSRFHGDALSPHLSKMVSTILRRLRDADSAVRAACAAATADMSANITRQPFSVLVKPLIESLVQDRDANAQIGAAMCLAAAVEMAPEPEPEQLRKALPKMGKLLRSEGFKAKPALLGAIGSVIGARGAGNKVVLDWLVPCITEFLSSEDWAARKAAAEALARVAMVEEDLAPLYKKPCLVALENRRFDKVKIVRETMNRTLNLWKEVPGDSEDVTSSPSRSKSSAGSEDGSIKCFPSVTRTTSADYGLKTPPQKEAAPPFRRSLSFSPNSLSAKNNKRGNPLMSNARNSSILETSKLDGKEPIDWKTDTDEPESHPSRLLSENRNPAGGSRAVESGGNRSSRPEVKRLLPIKIQDEKVHKFGGLRASSRVVPCNDENYDDTALRNAAEEVDEKPKDVEDLSLIRKQLAQIENQQSSLLDLLQRFIGSSQSGISSLESRVDGLEVALDEISYDLAISRGRIPNSNCSEDTCCKLPGAEFLSPKFWRKTEGRFHCSKSTTTMHVQSINGVRNIPAKDSNVDTNNPDKVIGKRDGASSASSNSRVFT